MNLQAFKVKDVGAKQGHKLLKSKADALKVKECTGDSLTPNTLSQAYFCFRFSLYFSPPPSQVRFREICKKIHQTKVGMSDQSAASFFSLTQAEYAAGNFRSKVIENNMVAQVRVSSRTDNVAGVKLPVFNQYETGAEAGESLGLGGGGRKIMACKEKFGEYLKALIKVASLQTSFVAMDEALKVTNRRVNALENVTLPKIKNVIDYINRELDELEREDFTRLKMVKKKKEAAIKAAEMAALDGELAGAPVAPTPGKASGNGEDEAKTEKKKKKKKAGGEQSTAMAAYDEDDSDVVFK